MPSETRRTQNSCCAAEELCCCAGGQLIGSSSVILTLFTLLTLASTAQVASRHSTLSTLWIATVTGTFLALHNTVYFLAVTAWALGNDYYSCGAGRFWEQSNRAVLLV